MSASLSLIFIIPLVFWSLVITYLIVKDLSNDEFNDKGTDKKDDVR